MRCGKSPVADSQDSIRPLVGDRVKLTVQLTHGDRLWVDDCDLDFVLFHQTLRTKPRGNVDPQSLNHDRSKHTHKQPMVWPFIKHMTRAKANVYLLCVLSSYFL